MARRGSQYFFITIFIWRSVPGWDGTGGTSETLFTMSVGNICQDFAFVGEPEGALDGC